MKLNRGVVIVFFGVVAAAKIQAKKLEKVAIWNVYDLSAEGVGLMLAGLTPIRNQTYATIAKNILTANRDILANTNITVYGNKKDYCIVHSNGIVVLTTVKNVSDLALAQICVRDTPRGLECVWRDEERAEIQSASDNLYYFVDNGAIGALRPPAKEKSSTYGAVHRMQLCVNIINSLAAKIKAEPKRDVVSYSVYDKNGSRVANDLMSVERDATRTYEFYRAEVSRSEKIPLARFLFHRTSIGKTRCIRDIARRVPSLRFQEDEFIFFKTSVGDACPRVIDGSAHGFRIEFA